MTTSDAMRALEAVGTAQNRKVYERHGVRSSMFGVSYADLGKLKKSIGTDQALSEALWSTGNHDARVLATMIADPGTIGAKTIDAWAEDLDNHILADAFSILVARSRHGRARLEKWIGSNDEWIGAVGWTLLGTLAMSEEPPPAGALEGYLATIERNIHSAKNRVRYAMNNALIAIGAGSDALERKAMAAAARIGTVDVDHGATGCKTPDARTYIPKTAAHRRGKTGRTASSARRQPGKTPPPARKASGSTTKTPRSRA
jgi:3-methyladenine DNA glycosylase AlkD